MNSKDLFESEGVSHTLVEEHQPHVTTSELRTTLGPATPHYTIRDTPLKLSCGVCKEELSGWNAHSCSPYLLKRIEALEAIVNRFICDGK